MFYDINVMNSKSLGAAWRLANQVPGDITNVGLTKICSSLNKCIETGRVSLRASAMLVNGAARVYKEEAEQLYEDCIKLNEEMIRRSNRPPIEIDLVLKPTEKDSRKRQRNTHHEYCYKRYYNPIQRFRNEMRGTCTISPENDLPHTSKNDAAESSSKTTKEIALQTAKSFISNKNNFPNNPNIDENQPFALVMVCDATSRIPKKIIYSYINI